MVVYKINIALAIFVLWCIPWYVYNKYIRSDNFHPMGTELLEIPTSIKCAIPYVSRDPVKNKCENIKIDVWALGHLAIYITLGAFLPGYTHYVFLLSIIFEMYEYISGWYAKWLIDPVINTIGYIIGASLFYVQVSQYKWLYSKETTAILSVILGAILYLNRPNIINAKYA